MKKNRIILTLVFVVMIAVAWFNQGLSLRNTAEAFNTAVSEADACSEKKLYKKSVDLYASALKLKEDETVREKWLENTELALKEGEITDKNYISALSEFVSVYPNRTDVWETIIKLSLDNMKFEDAKNYYEDAIETGADKNELLKYKNKIYYAVSEKNKIFHKVFVSSEGYSTVLCNDEWGIILPDGEWHYECDYMYIGPVINTDNYITTTSHGTKIYNNMNVAQAVIDDENVISKAISEGIIPLFSNNVWRFYDYQKEEYILDKYDDVSCFINGIAVVKTGEKWSVVNKAGEKVCDKQFDDIKLLDTGEYLINDIMIASVNGKYGIYDVSGNNKTSFEATDMDKYMGGYIAFKDKNGKWGFVDTAGNIVVEAKYNDAKSFSNGLAAVKVDDKWGFINKSGEIVIDCQYFDGGYFTKSGVCFVGLIENQYYMIALRFKDVI